MTAPAERTSGAPAMQIVLAAVLALGTATVALHDWFAVGGAWLDRPVEGWLYDAVVVAAGLTCLVRAQGAGRERLAWIAIGGAILAWGAAEVYWTLKILDDPAPPYPSPADVGYLAFYPLAALGLGLLVRARARELNWQLWMDGAIAALGTAALGAAFVFDYVADQTSGTSLQVATTLAYPLGDIAIISLTVGIIALTSWHPRRAWTLVLAGFVALAVADIAYTLQSTALAVPEGVWIDPIYLIAACCLAAGAWQFRHGEISGRVRIEGWRELVVPGVFAAVMIGLFAMQYSSTSSGLATVLTVGTMIAVIVRLAISVRENNALLQQVRTDPLTGLVNRGGMQVDLDERCGKATEEEPVAILLFDLNGFKRFNDTFGHPAGDELLTELGAGLRQAVGDDGIAYRFGGDEFCVLLTCPGDRFEQVSRRAAMALTASQKGVDVASSWGAATIPGDAASAHEAIQLADLRMYAQKESRRVSRDSKELDPRSSPQPGEAEPETAEQRSSRGSGPIGA
jgi:two-component system cell cycle response regulator